MIIRKDEKTVTKKKQMIRAKRTSYKEWLSDDKLILLTGWSREGLSNEQIAKNIGIASSTFYEWVNRFPEIRESIKKGKEVVDYEVENALFKNATGFHYTEEMVTNQGEVVEVTKYSTPQTAAQIFWLKNRKNLLWSNKDEVETRKLETEISYKEKQIEFLKKQIEALTGENFDTSLMDSLKMNGDDFFNDK